MATARAFSLIGMAIAWMQARATPAVPCTVGGIQLHPLFADSMVLQSHAPTVYGQAGRGTAITVAAGAFSQTVAVDRSCSWKVVMPEQNASDPRGNGVTITVSSSDTAVRPKTLTSVLFGDVWYGSTALEPWRPVCLTHVFCLNGVGVSFPGLFFHTHTVTWCECICRCSDPRCSSVQWCVASGASPVVGW